MSSLTSMQPYLQLNNLVKRFDDKKTILNNLSLDVQQGEFIVIVGASGCGKSTILRLIAGLDSPTEGSISLEGQQLQTLSPKDRDIAMVFQNYALYPHMSVYDNMAFGLKIRKLPKAEIQSKIAAIAETLGLTEHLQKKPRQLSGGQRQRVALGRAMVRNPKVFLMDEPLSNLDAKLRQHMRQEIAKLHQSLNATTLYVTHDQTEALTLADRIVVLDKGAISQVGSPLVVYNQPHNWFVANFMGQLNSIACTQPLVDWLPQSNIKPAGSYTVGFRPEKAVILAETARNPLPHVQTMDGVYQLVLTGIYRGKEVLGNEQQVFLQVDASVFGSAEPLIELKANGSAERCFTTAQSVSIAVPLSALFFFDSAGASLGL
jgi:multiple sugar transport system ATP-binding protein